MKIAIIDLLFSWPPHGGADVDVYYIARALYGLGHEPHVFVPGEPEGWERGKVNPEALPFPASLLDFSDTGLTARAATARFREAVDHFNPEVVFLTQGYFLKTPLIYTLQDYPILSRCYAHETACHKDILRFKNGAPCALAYATDPDTCRRCAASHLAAEIRRESPNAWTREYLAAEAWSSGYHRRFLEAMRMLRGIIITTDHMREQVEGLCSTIHVIPHGVDTERFTPRPSRQPMKKPVLFCPGRMVDPAKGFSVLMEAASRLAGEGYDFELRATLPEGHPGPPWLRALGDLDYDSMPEAYREADMCVIPSVWEEPFGIVALEAMATGIPVCATRTGGLQDIVTPETGLLFNRGDAADLARCLKHLLDHPEQRMALGTAGRKRTSEHFDWKHIPRSHYLPLLAGL